MVWGAIIPLTFSTLAIMIIKRQPENLVGWFMMLTAIAAGMPFSFYVENLMPPPLTVTPGLWILLWFHSWSWVPMIFPMFLNLLYFPTGRLPSPRWNFVPRLAVALWLLLILVTTFRDKITSEDGAWDPLPNPVGFIRTEWAEEQFTAIWGIGVIVAAFSSAASLFFRYRHANHVERQQIKWLLCAGAVFGVAYALTFLSESSGSWNNFFLLISILALPVAVAVAILRYRLYDIDIIIRRTLVYTILTASLGLIYFGTVVVLQTAVGQVTEDQSPLVIVISTLLIAALFSPLRRRIQSFIDRRFFRRQYDAAQILTNFAQTARDEVELNKLSAVLINVVEETLQPEQISLWIKSK
jgi:hypothetical protein